MFLFDQNSNNIRNYSFGLLFEIITNNDFDFWIINWYIALPNLIIVCTKLFFCISHLSGIYFWFQGLIYLRYLFNGTIIIYLQLLFCSRISIIFWPRGIFIYMTLFWSLCTILDFQFLIKIFDLEVKKVAGGTAYVLHSVVKMSASTL